MSGEGPTGSSSGFVCPTCKRAVAAAAPWRPFCTERCKMVDLGGWFLGKYRIAGTEVDLDEDGASKATIPDDPL